MASTYLTRTPSSTGNRRKFTFSAWVKFNFTSLVNNSRIFSIGNSTSDWVSAYFNSTGTLQLDVYVGGSGSNITTNRLFRDENAWYHVVFVVDTENSTADNRLRMYVNGEEETSLSSRSNPNVNWDTQANTSGKPVDIGSAENVGYSPRYFPGIMSHVHMTDGYAYAASDFGSTDSTTGEWKINTNPSVSYGTNGFFILKNDNGVTDQSPNSNNFTVSGTLVDYVDNPSNIFCTLNNRMEIPGSTVYNASSEVSNTNGSHKTIYGSIPFTSGKYYWEAKAKSGSAVKHTIGLSDVRNSYNYRQNSSANTIVGKNSNSYGRGDAIGWYYSEINKNGSTFASGVHQIANNDIMMVACDADNGKIYFGVNGTWRVANSTTFNASNHDTTFTTGKFYLPAFSNEDCGWFTNFGNGFFGATAISSAGTNASNLGTFEYDVPSGFTALCTKGLNE